MGQVRLKSLSLSGFRSFIDDCLIEFPETGLVLLTGGSGWGKSSVPLAISYALGFCPFPATELVSWGGVATLKVELVLQTSEGLVRVRRCPNLQLWVGDEQIHGGSKKIEERLRAILGLPPEMMALLTYRGQRKPGLFLSMTDAEKKEFLMALLGLHKFESAIDDSMARIRELERRQVAAEADRQTIQSLLTSSTPAESIEDAEKALVDVQAERHGHFETSRSIKKRVDDLKAEQSERSKAAALEFEPALTAARQKLQAAMTAVPAPAAPSDALQKTEDLITEIKGRIQRAEQLDLAVLNNTKSQLSELGTKATKLRAEIGKKSGLERDLARLEAEQTKLSQSICPTCARPWDDTAQKAAQLSNDIVRISVQLFAIAVAEEELRKVLEETASIPDWQPNPAIEKLRGALTEQQTKRAGEEQRLKGLAAEARSAHMAEVSRLGSEVSNLEKIQLQSRVNAELDGRDVIRDLERDLAALDALVKQLDSKIADLRTVEVRLRTQLEQVALLQTKLSDAKAKAEVVAQELAGERDFLALIGREGFLGTIFDEVLAEISDETNTILGTVANTRHCTLSFTSESVTEKGTIKKKISPVVSVAGHEAPLASALSGGMLSTVELATDLAVGAVVSRRAGVCPGWLILDESFEGLDPISKESCMEILTKYARDRLVLVIDHATEFRALFTKEIAVKFENGRSSIA